MPFFIFNPEICIGCRSCIIACKQHNKLPRQVAYRSCVEVERGEYPNLQLTFFSIACMHCTNPPCMRVCPARAIYKTSEGIVLVNQDVCIGCGYCAFACPFGVPTFNPEGKMVKCTFCIDRLEEGLDPACVSACLTGALDYATSALEASLKKKEGWIVLKF